jgi:hypothetical protein
LLFIHIFRLFINLYIWINSHETTQCFHVSCGLVGCDTMGSCRQLPTLQRNISPSSSGWSVYLIYYFTLKMEVIHSSEMLTLTYKTTWCYNLEPHSTPSAPWEPQPENCFHISPGVKWGYFITKTKWFNCVLSKMFYTEITSFLPVLSEKFIQIILFHDLPLLQSKVFQLRKVVQTFCPLLWTSSLRFFIVVPAILPCCVQMQFVTYSSGYWIYVPYL